MISISTNLFRCKNLHVNADLVEWLNFQLISRIFSKLNEIPAKLLNKIYLALTPNHDIHAI